MRIEDEAGPDHFRATIRAELDRSGCVEDAAQAFADGFYACFAESTVLVRVFGTVTLARLSASHRDFVRGFTARAGYEPVEDAETPVLTLLGTRGVEPAWSRPALSREHRAIPLVSAEFIEQIPMIARLFGELGFGPLRAVKTGSQYVMRAGDASSGLFFVGDARTTTDERGRLIIPAVEFVERYGVKTVFGFGATDPAQTLFLTVIVFSRHTVMRPDAARFVPLVNDLEAVTRGLLERAAIFAADR